ncbi:hypothetical protein FIBSPDRAFT_329576 [Athelia psychrophila]|uniref:Uncharacterized protein n=1 Tax=Athelia psychrophila TaxID=1759441 RepID=A0A167WK38_9AGAM|nr:hypothetical protein FIBSPDRAFT_329576 [Fibularhizoctonia sp. CBS 109695]
MPSYACMESLITDIYMRRIVSENCPARCHPHSSQPPCCVLCPMPLRTLPLVLGRKMILVAGQQVRFDEAWPAEVHPLWSGKEGHANNLKTHCDINSSVFPAGRGAFEFCHQRGGGRPGEADEIERRLAYVRDWLDLNPASGGQFTQLHPLLDTAFLKFGDPQIPSTLCSKSSHFMPAPSERESEIPMPHNICPSRC